MPNLFTNPGFETGTFSGWTVTAVTGTLARVGVTNGVGAANPLSITNTGVYAPAVYEGGYSAYSGTADFSKFVQALPTTNGATYDLSFWIGAHLTRGFVQVKWGLDIIFEMFNDGTNPDFWPTTPIDKFDSVSSTKPGVTGTLAANGCTVCGLGGHIATSSLQEVTFVIGECTDLWFFDLADLERRPFCPTDAGAIARQANWTNASVICPPTLGVTFTLTPSGPTSDLFCTDVPQSLVITE